MLDPEFSLSGKHVGLTTIWMGDFGSLASTFVTSQTILRSFNTRLLFITACIKENVKMIVENWIPSVRGNEWSKHFHINKVSRLLAFFSKDLWRDYKILHRVIAHLLSVPSSCELIHDTVYYSREAMWANSSSLHSYFRDQDAGCKIFHSSFQ